MTMRITALWRHPIKSHGREALQRVSLTEGQTMPWDRRWAVAHESAKTDGSAWSPCQNYSRGAKAASLMAINSQVDQASGQITLTHPERDDLTFDPDTQAEAFLEWVRPLMPEDRAQSAAIHRVPDRGMTDTDYPSVSLINLASNDAVSAELEQDISPLRWRCNIHFDGLPAWEELSWAGKTLRIGTTELSVRDPIVRCLATTADPITGTRDADTLGALKRIGDHQHFGIYAVVTKSGDIATGDTIEVL
jgi:uncharacterized protein YcbX